MSENNLPVKYFRNLPPFLADDLLPLLRLEALLHYQRGIIFPVLIVACWLLRIKKGNMRKKEVKIISSTVVVRGKS